MPTTQPAHPRRRPDVARYEDTKRALAARDWTDMNAYAEARTAVTEGIKARARGAG